MAPAPGAPTVVVKVGTSSLTAEAGGLDEAAIGKLASEVAAIWKAGREVVVVTSGAVSAGLSATSRRARPGDQPVLQALSAIGQPRLMRAYEDAFSVHGLCCGQVLLSISDFGERRQYLNARDTIAELTALDAVPVVNENDALANDEIRFGDNDRLAALVANLVGADCLVLLTDTEGLFDADPRRVDAATLIEEVAAADAAFDEVAGGPGSPSGRGGMATKLAAARLAAWCGVRAVIASAKRPDVIADALAGKGQVGTTIVPRAPRLSPRKAWIAFALPPRGRIVVDKGARAAVAERDASLLPAGVVSVEGPFSSGEAVEIADDAQVFGKGIARLSSQRAAEWIGKRSDELPADLAGEVVHRDDLVVLGGLRLASSTERRAGAR